MSCNGCRVLRKGCSETCILRPCLQWIDTPDSQGHATVFVAKFFGRADLMSFISNVPLNQRPALFQSLLYEACCRTVNPVSGAVGLMWTGNWHLCQAAVETVLRGGTLTPIPEFLVGAPYSPTTPDAINMFSNTKYCINSTTNITTSSPTFTNNKRRRPVVEIHNHNHHQQQKGQPQVKTPSFNSEESATTVSFESGFASDNHRYQPQLLNLFV